MAGVRRFDRDAVLEAAAQLFWRQGYEATSIQELETATGLGRGSLYNTFGDKEALFLDVLAHYGRSEGGPPLRHLGEPDALEGLGLMLRTIAARMDEPGRPRGCLITNTCLHGGGGTPVDVQIAAGVRALEGALTARFARARAEGQLAADADPRALARFYCAVIQSLGVMHKALGDRATLEDIVDTALCAWPKPSRRLP